MSLKLDWCSREAAKFACLNWHYSRALPSSKLLTIGVWEDDRFIGAVIFGRGATPFIGAPYGLRQTECVELVRVALAKHKTPVSRIVSIALKMLKKRSPGVRLVVSYADPEKGHHGGIYQAMNWIYVGRSGGGTEIFANGKWVHNRTVCGWKNRPKNLPQRSTAPKYKYLYPLDKRLRKGLEQIRKPFPQKEEEHAAVV